MLRSSSKNSDRLVVRVAKAFHCLIKEMTLAGMMSCNCSDQWLQCEYSMLEIACGLFDQAPAKNLIMWNMMICVYCSPDLRKASFFG